MYRVFYMTHHIGEEFEGVISSVTNFGVFVELDNTVEGMRHKELPIYSVQYHPEACPGPKDNDYIFDKFLELV